MTREEYIAANQDLNTEETDLVRALGFRAFRPGEPPILKEFVRPANYTHDLKRGSVAYHPTVRNYSYCTVTIPDGSRVIRCNFTQAVPNTTAIMGINLILEECNLVNCAIDPTWVLVGCCTVQNWIVSRPDGIERRQFICSHPSQLTGREREPLNVVKSRSF